MKNYKPVNFEKKKINLGFSLEFWRFGILRLKYDYFFYHVNVHRGTACRVPAAAAAA